MMRLLSGEGVDTPRLMDELMDLKRADTLGKAPSCFYYVETIEEMRSLAHDLLEAGEPYSLKMLAINGGDLIRAGVKPGPSRCGIIWKRKCSVWIWQDRSWKKSRIR